MRVGVVDAYRRDLNQGLSRAWARIGNICVLKDVRTAGFSYLYSLHEETPCAAELLYQPISAQSRSGDAANWESLSVRPEPQAHMWAGDSSFASGGSLVVSYGPHGSANVNLVRAGPRR